MSEADVREALDEALAILRASMDIVSERPADGTAPEWVSARGWTSELLALSDEALSDAERRPARWLAAKGTGSLAELAARADAFVSRFRFTGSDFDPDSDSDDRRRPRHVKARKQAQIDAFVAAASELSGIERVVDLGSGHGHLTRALGELVTEAIGIEREPQRAARARELGGEFVHGEGARAELRPGDLAVGLHPCGALGDALVRGARDAGSHVLMVSCCYQKTDPPERRWLAQTAEGFAVPRDALGLANLSPVSFAGSGTLADKRGWRRTRLALRLALEARGLSLMPGDEARGVTKERVRRGLRAASERAFSERALPPPSDAELSFAADEAARRHGRIARFALPRHALARVLELAIVLDRAVFLAEGGLRVQVRPLFGLATSPRNLAIMAAPG